MEELMDIKELGNMTKIKTSTLRKYVSKREIPFVKVGRLVRFTPAEIQEWLRKRRVAEKEKAAKGKAGAQAQGQLFL